MADNFRFRRRSKPRRAALQHCLRQRLNYLRLVTVCSLPMWLATVAARAQQPSVIPLVPAANWKLASAARFEAVTVARWVGDPAIEAEYGVKSIEDRSYQLNSELAGGIQSVDVVVEEAADASAAYGLLTYYQTETMVPEKGIQLAVAGRDCVLMARGRVFIRLIKAAGSHISEDEVRALEILVGGTRPTADALASLPAPLPPRGLLPGTERYLLGRQALARVLPSFRTDLLGFEQGAEVQTGRYTAGVSGDMTRADSPSTLLAIAYPTSQIARGRFALMQNALALNQERGPESVYGKRGGSFVFLVMNASSKAAATKLLEQFNVSEQISWNQRYPDKKSLALQLLELIVANLLLVVLLVGSAVLGGVLIAVSRRLARKWFPTSEWGSPEGERLITLNLR